MTTVTEVLPVQRPARTRAIAWEKAWWVPLAVILAAQAWLSTRLINHIPSSDEGRYIYAGHQLIYELWHGGGSPYYETYFSGAPVIYSPLAAVADHLGGLIAVRLMSVVFMLGANAMLFATTRRLFGYGAACSASGLFAVIGLTHSIGVYANYDAMSLMLLSVAAYFAVRAGESGAASRWLLLVPLTLFAANASKYPSLIFDPVVIVLASFRLDGWRSMLRRIIILGFATTALLVFAIYLAGTSYLQGVRFTTLARSKGASAILGATYTPDHVIIDQSWQWIGIIVTLGCLALLLAMLAGMDWYRVCLLGVMVFAGMFVTIEAIHLHSNESMGQHEDFGAWFTCIAAGYGLSVTPRFTMLRSIRYTATALATAFIVALGVHYAKADHVIDIATGRQIDNSLRMDALSRPYLHLPGGRYLISGGFAQMIYTDHVNIPWFDLADDNYIKYPIPGRGGDSHGQTPGKTCWKLKPGCVYLEGSAGYRAAIRAHWFTFISLYGRAQAIPQDPAIEWAANHTPGYVLITPPHRAPGWIYAPAYRHLAHTAAVTHKPAHPAVSPAGHGRVSAATIAYDIDLTFMPSLTFAFIALVLVMVVRWRRERKERN